MTYYQAESAVVVGDVTLNDGVSIWHQAVIRGDEAAIVIGEKTNIQDGCVLHVDKEAPLKIGANCTIGHRALVHGCTIEDDVLIGMGAIVLNGAHIGKGSIIGAGAVVLENSVIPPRSLVVGLPAKVKREIDDEQYQETIDHALLYVALAQESLSPHSQRNNKEE